MADTPIQPASGSLTATGVVAAMAMSLTFVPTVSGVSLAGAAPGFTSGTATVITPSVGAVTLAGVASTLTKPTSTVLTPTVGSVTLAGVASTFAQHLAPVTSQEGIGQWTVSWTGLANGQPGRSAPSSPGYETVFAQVTGTLGSGGSIQLEGSNDRVNWTKLSPAAITSGLPAFFAALGVNERPKYVRPNCTAGDTTTNLTVTAWFSS